MTFHIQTQDIALDGVRHKWKPASDTCQAYGFLEFGVTGHSVIVFLSKPAEADQVIAELVALRADMTADAGPVITDSGRTCDQRNPDGSGEPCHRDGEHARHRDSNGDEWGEAAGDEAVKAPGDSIAAGTPLPVTDDARICRPICGNQIPEGAWADGYRCCRECLSDQTKEGLARYDRFAAKAASVTA